MDRDKKSIFDDMERLKIKGGGKTKYLNKKKQSRAESIRFKKKAAQKIQREISSLKYKCKELKEKRSARKEADEPQEIVGNQFVCRKVKKQKKRS